MATAEKVIASRPPRDGRNWDSQCARCGSSTVPEDCDNCGGDGWIEADEDDWQGFDSDRPCDWCQGEGGWVHCCSSPEWCEANPVKGREDVKRGAIEWFTFDRPKAAK